MQTSAAEPVARTHDGSSIQIQQLLRYTDQVTLTDADCAIIVISFEIEAAAEAAWQR